MVMDPIAAYGALPSGAVVEEPNSGTLKWSPQGWTGQRVFRANAGQAEGLAPAPFSIYDNDHPWLKLTEVAFEPWQKDPVRYTAIVCNYSQYQVYDVPQVSIEYLDEALEMNPEGSTTGAYKWTSDGKDCTVPIVKPFTKAIITVEISRDTYDALGIMQLMNKVNNAEWNGFVANSLVFAGAPCRKQYNWDGTVHNRVQYKFLYWDHDQNSIWYNAKSGGADFDTTNPRVFGSADFTALDLTFSI